MRHLLFVMVFLSGIFSMHGLARDCSAPRIVVPPILVQDPSVIEILEKFKAEAARQEAECPTDTAGLDSPSDRRAYFDRSPSAAEPPSADPIPRPTPSSEPSSPTRVGDCQLTFVPGGDGGGTLRVAIDRPGPAGPSWRAVTLGSEFDPGPNPGLLGRADRCQPTWNDGPHRFNWLCPAPLDKEFVIFLPPGTASGVKRFTVITNDENGRDLQCATTP